MRSRFESVAKICRRWQRRYRRKGFGRVCAKQGGDRRSIKKERGPPASRRAPFMPSKTIAPLPGRSNRQTSHDYPQRE
jgi:hypothetical protein